jgi:hypothetical protein
MQGGDFLLQTNFKIIIEDSSRNRFLFYYSGSSVCCKELSKDGITRDTIIASQVNENFLVTIDIQDNIYVVCLNKDNGLYLLTYMNKEWKLDQKLTVQGNGSIYLLSLFTSNGAVHLLYAKHMAIAKFYNIYHLYKPTSSSSSHLNTAWKKNNVGEVYAENLNNAYSSVMTKDGQLHLVNEWYDGSSFVINYSWYDAEADAWRKKTITTLFKKDISVFLLYEDYLLHLLCYTYDEDVSAVFYYNKKEGAGKDFEFVCVDKIKTSQPVPPAFHADGGALYFSWVFNSNYGQYLLNKDQKQWMKKQDNPIPAGDNVQLVEYMRNRKGKALIGKKSYYEIDARYNVNIPYFKDYGKDYPEKDELADLRNAEGDLVGFIPYILDELKKMSEAIQKVNERLDQQPVQKKLEAFGSYSDRESSDSETTPRRPEGNRLRKSSFKDQFMNSNKLLSRPEAAALYVGSSELPNPQELSKKEGIPFAENNNAPPEEAAPSPQRPQPTSQAPAAPQPQPQQPLPAQPQQPAQVQQSPQPSLPEEPAANQAASHQELDPLQKDGNVFKKIGDFFK